MSDSAVFRLLSRSESAPGSAQPHPADDDASARRPDATRPAPPPDEIERHRRGLRQEFAVRISVALLIVVFDELTSIDQVTGSVIRLTALIALVLNVPYYLGIRSGVALRAQAHVRVLVDVALITAGLYGAGGLSAAPYVGVYAVVPVYTAFVFSSWACVAATAFATLSYVLVAALQAAGALPFTQPPLAGAWKIAAFNLLVLNIVGWLAALIAETERIHRHRLAALYAELERAHDQSLALNTEIQSASRRHVLSDVVAGVTHDVRNALQGAFGHLWLARRTGPPLSAEAKDHLDQVEEACESAMRIVRTTLDMARRSTPEREEVDVAGAAARIVELTSFDLRRDGIALRVEVPAALPRVLASAYQLEQVLLNLVANAHDELRGRAGRREIDIVGRAEPGRVIVEVRDSGAGMPLTVLPHVFEPFYTTKESGDGLGLAIAAGIVEGFGGTLTGENRREGGAVFRVTLPAAGGLVRV